MQSLVLNEQRSEQKRRQVTPTVSWQVEEYHRSLKQNVSLAKSPTRTETTQTNHFVAALWSFVKIELLKVQTNKNHYQLKAQLYFSALQQAFKELRNLQADLHLQPSTA